MTTRIPQSLLSRSGGANGSHNTSGGHDSLALRFTASLHAMERNFRALFEPVLLGERAANQRTTSVTATIRLLPGQIWAGTLIGGESLTCEQGLLWLTQSGDQTDYLLGATQHFNAQHRGQLVVQAMEESTFEVVSAR